MILLNRIARTFYVGGRPVHALQEFSLEVPAGDYLSIMGPSGSGKSTLLNLLGCLDRPTSGSYLLDGQEVADLGEAELTQVRRLLVDLLGLLVLTTLQQQLTCSDRLGELLYEVRALGFPESGQGRTHRLDADLQTLQVGTALGVLFVSASLALELSTDLDEHLGTSSLALIREDLRSQEQGLGLLLAAGS